MRTMIHLGPHAFPEIGGQVVQVTAFIVNPMKIAEYRGSYKRLIEGQSHEKEARFHSAKTFTPSNADFSKIPGSPVAYWLSTRIRDIFGNSETIADIADLKQGMSTTDSDRFVRLWWEASLRRIKFSRQHGEPADPDKPWHPFNKGGRFRKWYGNLEHIVDYSCDGDVLIQLVREKYPRISDPEFVIKNRKRYFTEAVTYTSVSSSFFGVRFLPLGFVFSVAGPVILTDDPSTAKVLLAFLCSKMATVFVNAINPSLGFQGADVGKLPIRQQDISFISQRLVHIAETLIAISKRTGIRRKLHGILRNCHCLNKRRLRSKPPKKPLTPNTLLASPA